MNKWVWNEYKCDSEQSMQQLDSDKQITFIVKSALFYKGYGVATISRLLKMIGLFCKRDL